MSRLAATSVGALVVPLGLPVHAAAEVDLTSRGGHGLVVAGATSGVSPSGGVTAIGGSPTVGRGGGVAAAIGRHGKVAAAVGRGGGVAAVGGSPAVAALTVAATGVPAVAAGLTKTFPHRLLLPLCVLTLTLGEPLCVFPLTPSRTVPWSSLT